MAVRRARCRSDGNVPCAAAASADGGGGGQAEAGAVAGEGVEEGIAGAVVAFGRGAHRVGDGGRHEEEVELGVSCSVGEGIMEMEPRQVAS